MVRTALSFLGCKRSVVPNQCMSLAEIIKRFVRREPLPVAKEGVYEERFGDLEKIARTDITEQMEKVVELRDQNDQFIEKHKKRKAKADSDAAAAAAAKVPPVVSIPPVIPPV